MTLAISRTSSHHPTKETEEDLEQRSLEQKKSALSQVFELLNKLSCIMQDNKRDFLDVVRHDLEKYREESDDLSRERNFQGWSVASLTLAGATLLGTSALVSEIAELGPNALDFIDSLGGAESVKKLCEASSQFSDGMKPAVNVFSESRITGKETNKQLLQLAFQRGQQAADQGSNTVEKLVSAALRLYETDARSKG